MKLNIDFNNWDELNYNAYNIDSFCNQKDFIYIGLFKDYIGKIRLKINNDNWDIFEKKCINKLKWITNTPLDKYNFNKLTKNFKDIDINDYIFIYLNKDNTIFFRNFNDNSFNNDLFFTVEI
jgi:hypothetical protein